MSTRFGINQYHKYLFQGDKTVDLYYPLYIKMFLITRTRDLVSGRRGKELIYSVF